MANNSEKKAEKKYQFFKQLYLGIIAGLYLFYIALRMVYWGDSFGFMNWVGLAIFSLINAVGLKFLFNYLRMGHPLSSYRLLEEVLWVNWIVMFLTTFSDYFWLLYLSVPGYLIYTYWGTISGFLGGAGSPALDPEMVKQFQEQQQQKKQKIRYARG